MEHVFKEYEARRKSGKREVYCGWFCLGSVNARWVRARLFVRCTRDMHMHKKKATRLLKQGIRKMTSFKETQK